VRTSFCQNLHAKCYLNERYAIITSMNLYDFSQVNNNEMGVIFDRDQEQKLYRDTYEEAQRLIRISDEVRLAAEKVQHPKEDEPPASDQTDGNGYDKLTTFKLAKALGLRTADLNERLLAAGLVEKDGEGFKVTGKGKEAGGELRYSKKFGPFFLWPADLKL
jgi:hypothetical protein